MNIGLFKRPHAVRRYGQQSISGGHASAPYSDSVELMNVQPLSSDDLQALPEGDRAVKRVKSFGKARLSAADDSAGTPGDRLFYDGKWYECVSSVGWLHTPLSHWRSEFVLLPHGDQGPPPNAMEGGG